jgi:hypothetical protein
VAIYFLSLKAIGRSGGGSAVSAAAYRSGERLRDERTGRTYDHTDRRDVLYKEILLPGELAKADMSWAKDRARLWNAAESAESRKNSRVAREYLVALPVELKFGQRLDLARGFAQELVDRYRFALDLTIHAPRDYPDSDPRNFHAHLLATTREATAMGLTAKTTLEYQDSKRRDLGMQSFVHELFFVRERWAVVTNAALRDANIDARVDHRSLKAQGIEREPYPYIPQAAFQMERHGYPSAQAERLRAEYQERVQARAEREAARGNDVVHRERDGVQWERGVAHRERDGSQGERNAAHGERNAAYRADDPSRERAAPQRDDGSRREWNGAHADRDAAQRADAPRRERNAAHGVPEAAHAAPANAAPARDAPKKPQTLDDIRRQAREDWLRMRQEALANPGAEKTSVATPQRTMAQDRSNDDDLSL